jgi:putative DNA primase/helicase
MNDPREHSCENEPSGALAYALGYARRGWSVIPIPHQSKRPLLDGWQQLRLKESDFPQHFNGAPQNIGVLTGEPSSWVVDVDLDHPRAVELADEFLPPTPAVFGRPGKPRSHRFYRALKPVATKQHRSKSAGMIVELRSTGLQTVVPPSTHESGEPITWETEGAEPAEVDPGVLAEIVKRLADTVKVELGEKAATKPKKERLRLQRPSGPCEPQGQVPDKPQRCLRAMLRIGMADHKDGSRRLFGAACRCVEHDLSDAEAVPCIRAYEAQKPFPKPWTDTEILQRLRDAEKVCTRGQALETEADGLTRLGARDPDTGRLVLSPRRTLPTAEAFLREFHTHVEGRTLLGYAGLLMAWRDNRWGEVEDETLKHRLQTWLHEALRYVFNKGIGEMMLADFESNPGTIGAALDSIRTRAHLPALVTPPVWLSEAGDRPPAREILACRTLNLHIPTGRILSATPALFTTCALEFDYDPDATVPRNWLKFLNDLWDDDRESIALLQEWFGYCLTADTSQQKMLLLVGPRRSGKGTIGRILALLIGEGNRCGPTVSSLAGAFGLQPLIGKSLAIVSDARFCGDDISTVAERLLCISGEDPITIDRKYLTAVTLRLPTRFMFLSNDLPQFTDASGALAGRFMVLRLTQNWFGREDLGLEARLTAELPGILLWALQGWVRLHERGRFVQPASSDDVIRELEDLTSPVGAFVRERCVVGSSHSVEAGDLFAAWKEYCASVGRDHVGTAALFGRNLRAVVPGLHVSQPRTDFGRTRWYEGICLCSR